MGAARGLGSFRIGLRTLVLTIVMNFCLFHLRGNGFILLGFGDSLLHLFFPFLFLLN